MNHRQISILKTITIHRNNDNKKVQYRNMIQKQKEKKRNREKIHQRTKGPFVAQRTRELLYFI